MMIKLANEAERKSKLAKSTGPKKVATISLSEKWINWLLVALLAFQVFLNIAAYNAALTGMKNVSLLFVGIILLVFAAFFHIYRYGMSEQKNAPPPPPVQIEDDLPKLAEPQAAAEKPMLPEDAAEKKSETKELAPEVSVPKTKSDTGVGADTLDHGDPNKPRDGIS